MKLQKATESFEKQISILRDDYHLEINDDVLAKTILINMNYYCVKGYGLAFGVFDKTKGKVVDGKPIGQFNEGVTIENIYKYFNLDVEFKTILFNAIHIIEKNVRSTFANFFSLEYQYKSVISDKIHLSFNNSSKVYSCFNDVIKKNYIDYIFYRKSNSYNTNHYFNNIIKWHVENYDNDYPLWVLIEYLDFGKTITCLENINHPKIKNRLRSHFGFGDFDVFVKSLKSIKEIRNRISHFHRLVGTRLSWNRLIDSTIEPNYINNLNNDHIFTFLLVIKKFMEKCDENKWNEIKNQIITFLNKNPDFMNSLHAPANWETLLAS